MLRRLRSAPEDVQEAICLASVQGISFACSLVSQLAEDILGRSVRDALGKAEHPYSMVVGPATNPDEIVAQFAERLFHQVAVERRRSLKSLGGEEALQEAL